MHCAAGRIRQKQRSSCSSPTQESGETFSLHPAASWLVSSCLCSLCWGSSFSDSGLRPETSGFSFSLCCTDQVFTVFNHFMLRNQWYSHRVWWNRPRQDRPSVSGPDSVITIKSNQTHQVSANTNPLESVCVHQRVFRTGLLYNNFIYNSCRDKLRKSPSPLCLRKWKFNVFSEKQKGSKTSWNKTNFICELSVL